MGLCTAFVFAALVEFTIVNFWFRKHRKSKENALALMLPFVSTASNLTAATQMSAAAKTENTMRANQKKVETIFKIFISFSYSSKLNFLYKKKYRRKRKEVYLLFCWQLSGNWVHSILCCHYCILSKKFGAGFIRCMSNSLSGGLSF